MNKIFLKISVLALLIALVPLYGADKTNLQQQTKSPAASLQSGVQEKEKASPSVQTILTHSKAMGKNVATLVVLPDSYFKDGDKTRYPVVYLLHGHGGNHRSWIGLRPDIQKLSSEYGIIFVCPDGGVSWYWDSPKNPELKYETYVSKELVSQIDQKYRTIKSPAGRAITGLSMGGHGGLWLGFRHQDVFGACGSMSGGVDIRPFPKNWHMSDSLGDRDSNREIWDSHTVINQVHLLKPHKLAIIIDCGTEDFFYNVNEALHAKLLENKIPHDYTTRPGRHNSPYWRNSILYHLKFFDSFFHDPDFLRTRQGAPNKK